MLDVIMLALVAICFACAAAYARLCNHMLAPPIDQRISP